ncbi:MAG TPA: SRPBCC domain-containing protein [Saprospiraceae bacterium]|nr:SRPBCC domain-containing protein [Saprospiraceae bacterium]
MADLFHKLPIKAPPENVFQAMTTPTGLDSWWTKTSEGKPSPGEIYRFSFGPEYHWKAIVTKSIPDREWEWTFIDSDADWNGSKVGFSLSRKDGLTWINFYHMDWREDNEHFRISNYCWAMYLRILKRYLEYGEEVAYEDRLEV